MGEPLREPNSATPEGDLWKKAGEYFRRLGPAGYLAIIAASLPAIGGFVLIGFSGNYVAPWLRQHGTYGPVIYAAGFTVLAGFALLPTYAQSLLGGWAFGLKVGLIGALAGFAGASCIAYVIARRAAGDRVIGIINEHPKWRAVYDALLGRGFWRTLGIVTLIRVPPNSPFALTNLVMAATRVPLPIYLIGTVVGMAPRTAAVVYLGTQLKDWDAEGPSSKWGFAISVAVTIIVVAVIGHIANKALAKFTGPGERPDQTAGRAPNKS